VSMLYVGLPGDLKAFIRYEIEANKGIEDQATARHLLGDFLQKLKKFEDTLHSQGTF